MKYILYTSHELRERKYHVNALLRLTKYKNSHRNVLRAPAIQKKRTTISDRPSLIMVCLITQQLPQQK